MLTAWYPAILSLCNIWIYLVESMYSMDFIFSWSGSESSESDPQSPARSCLAEGRNSKSSPSTLHWLLFAQKALIWILGWGSAAEISWSMGGWDLGLRSSEGQRFFATDYERCKSLSWDTIQHHTAKNIQESSQRIFKVVFFRRLLHSFFRIEDLPTSAVSANGRQFPQRPFGGSRGACVGSKWFFSMVIPSWTHKKLTMLSIKVNIG